IIGPNCIGIYDPTTGVDMVFLPEDKLKRPKPGPISILTQSGALGAAMMNELMNLTEENWIAHMISFGNAADVNENDAIDFFLKDDQTKIIWAYLEGFRTGDFYMQKLREVCQKKPVVTLKANRTAAGAHASASHSASLAVNDEVTDYLLKQAGSIRATTWVDLFDIGRAVLKQPLPKGRRTGLVSDGGGMLVMCSDAVDRYDLILPELEEKTVTKFYEEMPSYYVCRNPIDLTGSASSDDFIFAVKLALEDINVDAVICINLPCVPNVDVEEFVEKYTANFGIKDGVDNRPKKTLLTVALGGTENQAIIDGLEACGLPVYTTEEQAVRVLKMMVDYQEFLEREEKIDQLGSNAVSMSQNEEIDKLIASARSENRTVMLESEAREIFRIIGLPVPKSILAKTAEEAVSFYKEIGRKVVMKLVSPEVIHKTDEGAVFVGLNSEEEVRSKAEHLLEKFKGRDPRGLLVVDMVPNGLEMMIGMNTDPTFGQIVISGFGGILVEILKDVSFNMCPTHQFDAEQMLTNLEHQELLEGFRGMPKVDLEAFAKLIVNVSQLAAAYKDDIKELDINPILITEEGQWAVDARIILHEK
ncbi:MAG: acetate--CoA ligase family protein, partial [Candidatus Heimdallarchaeota archaeon]|nr:acetate--CoA ligase family protein [Candidatus Heimdallarchaeota archaeon]MCK5049056.1 acetate--CoA ligase family protein [Candidatus Heimdallarchaeota archaeon]